MHNPLDDVEVPAPAQGGVPVKGQHQYFLKVVPTTYSTAQDGRIETNQFSVTEHFKPSPPTMQELPGIFFFYDLSPLKVRIVWRREDRRHGQRRIGLFMIITHPPPSR